MSNYNQEVNFNGFVFASDIHMSSTTPSSRIDLYPNSIRKKLEEIVKFCREGGYVLILGGDLFNKPTQPDYIKDIMISIFEGVEVYSITGNHDVIYFNESYNHKVSLNILYRTGVIKYLDYDDYLEINGYRIRGLSLNQTIGLEDNNLFEGLDSNDIVVAHSFLGNSQYDDSLKINTGLIRESGMGYLLLGHDHNEYETKDYNGTKIIRPGAVSRGTSHTENMIRDPQYVVFDINEGVSFEYKDIECVQNFDDVFKSKFQDVKKTSFKEVESFIDFLKNADVDENVYDILVSMDLDKIVHERTSYYLREAGVV